MAPISSKIFLSPKMGDQGGEGEGGLDYNHYYELKSITFVMLLFMNK